MAMENPFEGKEVWFGVGSQDLYGEEALRQVAEQSGEIVDALNATGKIPVKVVLKPTLKSSDGVKASCRSLRQPERHRRDHLVSHLLPGQDVDPRPRSAHQAAAAAQHAAPLRNPVGNHRHGLHEPEPGRTRRP